MLALAARYSNDYVVMAKQNKEKGICAVLSLHLKLSNKNLKCYVSAHSNKDGNFFGNIFATFLSYCIVGISDKKATDPSISSADTCAVCLCNFTDKTTLTKCSHSFCAACIDRAFKVQKKCPVCSTVYGLLIGNQPEGEMFVSQHATKIPGYESCGGCIVITYKFQAGVQGENHPNPGKRYSSTIRHGYLPNNREGQKVLKLLRKAFNQKLTFTIGRSSTTGADVITWNDIHHKTSIMGGPTRYVKDLAA